MIRKTKRENGPDRYRFGAARRIILQCVLWYLAAAALFAAAEAAIVSANVDRDISERIRSVESRVEPALVQAVWNLDDALVALILGGVCDDPAVSRVELRDEDGRTLVSLSSRGAAGSVDPSGGGFRVFPLSYSSAGRPPRRIGELRILPSTELRNSRIRETALFSLERTVLFVLALSAILSLAIENGLGRPLREFARRIAEVDPARPGKNPIAFSRTPIGELARAADAFNAMAAKIGETLAALNEHRARLWSVFDDSPISLWEEDFSELKRRVDQSSAEGIVDWDAFFADPARSAELCSLIRVIDVNRSTLELLGAESKRAVLGPLSSCVGDQPLEALRVELAALAGGALSWEGESMYLTSDGRRITLHIRLGVVPGHEADWSRVLVSMLDVSERKNAEDVLRRSLREKELLLKEVHHRVKNNLQIICSLIGIQSASVAADSETAASLSDIESRVWSMALVHELLYENQDFAALDFPDYVRRLCDRVGSGLVDDPERVRVEVSVEEEVRLVLEKAIPCGLLINELVVNAFKHAFPEGRRGTIRIAVARAPDGLLRLVVADDGVGVADPASLCRPGSIGFMLIESLALQLGGTIAFNGEGGFRAELSFPD